MGYGLSVPKGCFCFRSTARTYTTMADCGASGSALERTVRSVLGGVGNSSSSPGGVVEVGASWFQHALIGGSVAQGTSVAMPAVTPDHLLMVQPTDNSKMLLTVDHTTPASYHTSLLSYPETASSSSHFNLDSTSSSQNAMGPTSQLLRHGNTNAFQPASSTTASWMMPQPSAFAASGTMQPHYQHPWATLAQQQYHQQQMTLGIMMQQQIQFQRYQQQQMHLIEQQRYHRQQAQEQQQNDINILSALHQGEDDIQKSRGSVESSPVHHQQPTIESVREQVLGHEGIVQGATIEDLALAWAETQIDLEQDQRLLDEAVVRGHEGMVDGATIEDLAVAWAEAQSDLELLQQQQQKELLESHLQEGDWADAANLWQYTEDNSQSVQTYSFINKRGEAAILEGDSGAQLDWMEEGRRHFRAGNMREAIQSFEMELQQHNMDNASAWYLLGRCHAENDMDQYAIQCLEQAIERDPYATDALLALGVSYVNELNHKKALDTLMAWITHNPKFAGLELDHSRKDDLYCAKDDFVNSNDGVATRAAESALEEVQRLLLCALDYDQSGGASGDVWEALGVIYNVSRDYPAAIEAFHNSIKLRPNDYQLYNRLGATLANSRQSEQALSVYQQALQIKPKYARAWLNMAIAHSNLQNYREAARCYLQTLSLNPAATHCWSYLRIALSACDEWGLIPLVAAQDLTALSEHFDFVRYD